jgi:hydrogenase maturation protease
VSEGAGDWGEVLVVGYGNPLRGDDGIGPHVAGRIAARGFPGVRVLSLVQLVPELAADLAGARLVVFVDARIGGEEGGVEVVPVAASGAPGWAAHAADPGALLALTGAVYGRVPEAVWVLVSGVDFGPGEGLSPAGARNARAAVDRVEALLRDWTL